MARITRLEPSQVDDQVREIFDAFLKERGNIPNMFRTVAHRPHVLKTMIAHFKSVMGTGTLGAKLKELLFVRVSQLNHCDYWLASHSILAVRQGWTEEQVKNCGESRDRTDFTPREKAALALAERMTRDSNGVDDALWREVREHFDEAEALELAVSIGLFNYFNMVNNALQMEPTK